MTEQSSGSDDTGVPEDQDAEPGSQPTGAAAHETDAEDQDAGPASEPDSDATG